MFSWLILVLREANTIVPGLFRWFNNVSPHSEGVFVFWRVMESWTWWSRKSHLRHQWEQLKDLKSYRVSLYLLFALWCCFFFLHLHLLLRLLLVLLLCFFFFSNYIIYMICIRMHIFWFSKCNFVKKEWTRVTVSFVPVSIDNPQVLW